MTRHDAPAQNAPAQSATRPWPQHLSPSWSPDQCFESLVFVVGFWQNNPSGVDEFFHLLRGCSHPNWHHAAEKLARCRCTLPKRQKAYGSNAPIWMNLFVWECWWETYQVSKWMAHGDIESITRQGKERREGIDILSQWHGVIVDQLNQFKIPIQNRSSAPIWVFCLMRTMWCNMWLIAH